MEVAVGIGADDLVLAIAEVRHSRTANSEVTQLTTVLGSEIDEGDMVLIGGRMRSSTNRNAIMTFTELGDDGYVLLLRSIDGIGLELLHGLVTAYGSNTRVNDAEDNVPTNGADVK